MANARLPFRDGDFTKPSLVQPPYMSNDPVTLGPLVTYTFCQLYTSYLAAATKPGTVAGGIQRGARDRYGYYLVEWSEPRSMGGGIVEWTRTFAGVPTSRVTYESFNYTYQYNTQTGQIIEQPLLVNSRVVRSYRFTTKPETIPLKRALRLMMFGSILQFVGDPVNPNDRERLGEDETLIDYKGAGVIWGKVSRYVPNRASNRFV